MIRGTLCSLLLLVALTGCTDGTAPESEPEPEPEPEVPELAELCTPDVPCTPPEAVGTNCGGATPLESQDYAVLTTAGEPYGIEGTVEIGTLLIEPGVTVCAAGMAALHIRKHLQAGGTPEQPVVFTAADPTAYWRGISGAEPTSDGGGTGDPGARIQLSLAVVEHALVGVIGPRIEAGGVRFRQTRGPAISAVGTFSDLAVDSACTSGCGNGEWSYGAIALTGPYFKGDGRHSTVTRAVVRGSGSHGLQVFPAAGATLSDVSIERPQGSGLDFGPYTYFFQGSPAVPSVTFAGPVHVHEPGGYLAQGYAPAVAGFLEQSDGIEPGDSVQTTVECGYPEDLNVPRGLTWYLDITGVYMCDPVVLGRLDVAAGAMFRYRGSVWPAFESIRAVGTAEAPARLNLGSYGTASTGDLVTEHARLLVANLEATGAEQRLRDTEFVPDGIFGESGDLVLRGGRAVLERVSLDGVSLSLQGAGARAAAVRVHGAPGHGIRIAADSIEIHRCLIASSDGDGIHVESGRGLVVRDCDLVSNAGAGLANTTADTVDARHNWWGDPAGPLGPAGDGVEGHVNHDEPLTGPVSDQPVSVTITRSTDSVAVADTVRFGIEARDADGLRVPAAAFELELVDGDLVDFPDPADPLLARGLRPGVARVRAVHTQDPSLAVTDSIVVVPGAPLLRWERLGGGWNHVLPFTRTRFVTAGGDRPDISAPDVVRLWHDGATTDTWITVDAEQFVVVALGGTALDDLWAAVSTSAWTGENELTHGPDILMHWDGVSWTPSDTVPGDVNEIWAVGPARVVVLWEDGIREWRDGSWSDAWVPTSTTDGGGYCHGLAVGSPTNAYARCQDDPYAPEPLRLHFDGDTWEPATLPPLPDLGGSIFMAFMDPTDPPILIGSDALAVLENGAWRTFDKPRVGIRRWARYGEGAFILGGPPGNASLPHRTLWHLTRDLAWQGVWVPPPVATAISWDFASADGALFVAAAEHLFRAMPEP